MKLKVGIKKHNRNEAQLLRVVVKSIGGLHKNELDNLTLTPITYNNKI
jgi:hypothetical protein